MPMTSHGWCPYQLERGCYEILLPKARVILRQSFSDLRVGRHTAKPAHHLCCSLAVLIDPELKDIAVNFIICHVPFIPGILSQRGRT